MSLKATEVFLELWASLRSYLDWFGGVLKFFIFLAFLTSHKKNLRAILGASGAISNSPRFKIRVQILIEESELYNSSILDF